VTELLVAAGRRFARLVTRLVVRSPRLWRLLRRPLQAQFDWLAPSWESRRSPEDFAALEALLDRLDAPPTRILDLGTGTGLAARLVARRYPDAEVVGADLSEQMIEEARRVLPSELAGRVSFEVADAAALPYPAGRFDLVVLLNMIPFFGELARVTEPGGAVVFGFSSGSETPIYVPTETLRKQLEPLGFGGFEEVAVGTSTAVIAQRKS
jgi:ubiquinone/menaquinone biosynthesis C-methylase UbiE